MAAERTSTTGKLTRELLGFIITGTLFVHAVSADEFLQTGDDIYNYGRRGDGSPVKATVQSDVPLPTGQSACVTCHRRSGLGVAEGGNRALNITGPRLFSSADPNAPDRSAYDDATLTRAIITGVAADGRTLDRLMPRYQLTAEDSLAIAAYLRQLGATPSPGVTNEDIIIATVITPDAPVYERQAVEDVVARFVEIKNSDTRRETERAATANRHAFGVNHYRAYRHWQHSFWRLQGSPESWLDQLQHFYELAPPFALVSGAAGGNWDIVARFCEDQRLPCVLPAGAAATSVDDDFYSLYFSTGIILEAEVVADHLAKVKKTDGQDVLVVFESSDKGANAASAFNRAWHDAGYPEAAAVELRSGVLPSKSRWEKYLSASNARFVVAFVSAEQLRSLTNFFRAQAQGPDLVYSVESLASLNEIVSGDAAVARLLHVYPYALPTDGKGQFPRERAWLSAQGFQSIEPISASKALFACHVFGEALADIKTNFSRDYLMESFEHALDGTQMTSLYPRTIAGPDQRLLAHGAYVGGVAQVEGRAELVSAVWIQP